jgi:hypothetical protein
VAEFGSARAETDDGVAATRLGGEVLAFGQVFVMVEEDFHTGIVPVVACLALRPTLHLVGAGIVQLTGASRGVGNWLKRLANVM